MEKIQKKGRRLAIRKDSETAFADELGCVHIDRRNVVILMLALTTIVLGFVCLALGGKNEFLGTTVSAVLLVIGYLVLVPWAILTGRAKRRQRHKIASDS